MVDPFSALSVAGNIVQFVDFSCRLVQKASEISHSANGACAENVELEEIGTYLKEFSSDLVSSTVRSGIYEPGLRDLATSSHTIAEELLAVIGQLRGSTGRFKSFRQALKSVWHHDKVLGMQKRLHSLRGLMTIIIVSIVR